MVEPYENLLEDFQNILEGGSAEAISSLADRIRWSIRHSKGGDERRRLYELLSDVVEVEKRFRKQSLSKSSAFRGQAGKFVALSFGHGVPEFLMRAMVTPEMRVVGAQAYDFLAENEGLFFEYLGGPVTHHMGDVKFPLDIIFLDKDADDVYTISKIAFNVLPGSKDLFSCPKTFAVVEVNGGVSTQYEISPGDTVRLSRTLFYSYYPDLQIHKEVLSTPSGLIDLESVQRWKRASGSAFYVADVNFSLTNEEKQRILKECQLPREKVLWRKRLL